MIRRSFFAILLASCGTSDAAPPASLPAMGDDASSPPGPGPSGGSDAGVDARADLDGTMDGTTQQDASVACPESRKRCAVDFAFSGAADAVVELRGDWVPTAWASGVPMTNFGSQWRRSLLLPPGTRVESKFCVDPHADGTCTLWQADPAKPTVGPDGNNVVASVSCTDVVCIPETGALPPPIRFIAVGDTGKLGPDAVTPAMAAKCQTSGCDFVLLLGDNIYDDGASSPTDPQLKSKFEDRFAAVHAPFHVVLGNHDYGGLGMGSDYAKAQNEVDYTQYSNKWKMPSRYYKFSAGNAELFALDTNAQMYALAAAQKVDVKGWIQQSQATWKIAFGHHPYLSNGPHGNAGVYDGNPGTPIFNGVGVKDFAEEVYCGTADLYLCGHDHSRQWMTDTCKGTQLAVSGAGASATTLPGANATKFQSLEVGFLYVTVEGTKLTAEFVSTSGASEFTTVLTK